MSAITLKKIAQTLSLSISTVSRALKDHPDISKDTVKRVREVAEALDYEPNANAIHLKKQDSRLFAVLVPNLSNFYASFISGLEEECRKEDYNLMILQNGDNVETEKLNLKLCRHNRVSGAFVCMCTNPGDMNEYRKLIDNEIPLLFFDKVPENNDYNKITNNDEKAAEMAAIWIKSKKYKSILALFGNEQLSITKRRLKSFTKLMENNSVTYINASSTTEAKELSEKLLHSKKFDCIFCMSDEILIGVMPVVQKLKFQSKIDSKIIAISDGFFPSIYFPSINYVETSGYKLAKNAYLKMDAIRKDRHIVDEYMVEPLFMTSNE